MECQSQFLRAFHVASEAEAEAAGYVVLVVACAYLWLTLIA